MSVTVTITATCTDHPHYTGQYRARRSRRCWRCSDVYYLRRPENLISECQIEKVEVQR